MTTTDLRALATMLDSHGLLVSWTEDENVAVHGAACDSRHTASDNIFICKGEAFRPAFLVQALGSGASAYLCDEDHADVLAEAAPGTPHIVASDIRRAMAYVSAEAWGRPDRDLKIVGITGTKGKSTTTYLLRSAIDALGGAPCAFMGTHDVFDGLGHYESVNTTPEAPDLWRHLANAREAGLEYVVMEVSSQGLKYDRTLGLDLAVGCFLNIGNDHISPVEHPTFEDYLASKLRIFEQAATCVCDLETEHADLVLSALYDTGKQALTFAVDDPEAAVHAEDVRADKGSMHFTAVTPHWTAPLMLSMAGRYNVSNALAAVACMVALGIDGERAAQACAAGFANASVPGRMNVYATADGLVTAIVDYAHNDISYQKFFDAIDEVYPGRYRVSAFGVCGGKALNRYVDLPKIGSERSNLVVLTSDEPGPCDPAELIDEISVNITPGVPFEKRPDRGEAVDLGFELAARHAAETGQPAVFCALGKGAEATMMFGKESRPIEPDTLHVERLVREYDQANGLD